MVMIIIINLELVCARLGRANVRLLSHMYTHFLSRSTWTHFTALHANRPLYARRGHVFSTLYNLVCLQSRKRVHCKLSHFHWRRSGLIFVCEKIDNFVIAWLAKLSTRKWLFYHRKPQDEWLMQVFLLIYWLLLLMNQLFPRRKWKTKFFLSRTSSRHVFFSPFIFPADSHSEWYQQKRCKNSSALNIFQRPNAALLKTLFTS